MGITTLMLLGYLLTFILIIVIISLLLRIKHLEKKLVNFTPTEAYTIMETMRDMVIESEHVADKLDSSIKEREACLEDLSDLVDAKLARLDTILSSNKGEVDIKTKIFEMYMQGRSDADIARLLNISITEVRIAINLQGKNI